MNRAQRRAQSRAKPPTGRRARTLRHPVARAFAARELRDAALDAGIACLSMPHNAGARTLLAKLAFFVGLGAELAANHPVAGSNRAGMHQALAEIVRMSCNDCRWNAGWALQLQLAIDVAAELILEHGDDAIALGPSCKALADEITRGTIRPDAIVPFAAADEKKGSK